MTAPRSNASRDQNFSVTLIGVSTADGTTPVPIEVDPATGQMQVSTSAVPSNINLAPTSNGGWSPYFANAVTTVVSVKSGAGKFGGYMLLNLNSAPAYLQVFDSNGTVTLGVTAPTFVIPIPANATAANGLGANLEMANGVQMSNGIKVAATTTPNGASAVGTGLSGSIWFT